MGTRKPGGLKEMGLDNEKDGYFNVCKGARIRLSYRCGKPERELDSCFYFCPVLI